MAASVRLVLRRSKTRADGRAPVWIRVTKDRRTRFTSTGIWLKPRDWNEKRDEVRKSHDHHAALNATLSDLKLDAESKAAAGETAESIKRAIKGTNGSLTDFFAEFVESLSEAGKYWEWRKYRVTYGKLTAVFGTSIAFSDIDHRALRRLEKYLREQLGNAPNTIRKEFQRLRRVYREALRQNVITPERDPFLLFDPPQSRKPQRRKLSEDEIEAFANVELDSPFLRAARDAFLFAYYGSGVRCSDLFCLTPENVKAGRLRYRMMKTGSVVDAPLPARAQALAARYATAADTYLFPFLKPGNDGDGVNLRRRIASAAVRVNRALKDVAVRAGIDPEGLSTHVARHSYADYARRTAAGDLYGISKSLGHKNLSTTERYLAELDRDAIERLHDKLWS